MGSVRPVSQCSHISVSQLAIAAAGSQTVFVYLCSCVVVYLCICVFVYLCICISQLRFTTRHCSSLAAWLAQQRSCFVVNLLNSAVDVVQSSIYSDGRMEKSFHTPHPLSLCFRRGFGRRGVRGGGRGG